MGSNFSSNDAELESYKQQLVDRIGKHEYNKIVKEQIRLIEEYIYMIEELKNLYTIDGEIPQKAKEFIDNVMLERNPFLINQTNNEGFINVKAGISKKVVEYHYM
jgi:hypothetical protein